MTDRTAEMLLEILRASGADGWELSDTQEEGWEFYFIRHALDQNRVKRVRHFDVRVYRSMEDGRLLGSAGGEIQPTATREQAEQAVAALLRNAAYVKNPAYTLNKPVDLPQQALPTVDVQAIAADFLSAMRELPETETEDVNSWELFVSSVRRRFVNSEGIDVTSVYPQSMAEVVVNARQQGREIELYRLYHSGGCDREQLKADLGETLRIGRDKLLAGDTPALGQADVLFSGSDACSLYEWFAQRVNARLKVMGFSSCEVDQPVSEELSGDRVTLRVLPALPNSSRNMAFDREGAPVEEATLIEDGVVRRFVGDRQFSQYLGLERSFIPGNYAVIGGTADEAELRAGDYLELVEFSDFQVNPVTGDIAGEIRLAYWHHNGQCRPVSGGSVGGSLLQLLKTMRFSKAQRQYNNMLIPSLTRLYGVSVTGIS